LASFFPWSNNGVFACLQLAIELEKVSPFPPFPIPIPFEEGETIQFTVKEAKMDGKEEEEENPTTRGTNCVLATNNRRHKKNWPNG
jgi:hypothetical protein